MASIVVCVKYVPDASAERRFDPADSTVDRIGVDGLLSELDEYAVEEALQLGEATGGEVTVLTVGPEPAGDAIRKALQMGAARGVHVLDDAIHGSDAIGTSLVLAAALRRLQFDLVLCGMASTDGVMGVVPAMLAERMGLPQLTYAADLALDGDTVTLHRDTDTALETVVATTPAVVSVTDQINEPRYPSFKGIMAAKKKPVDTWSLADLGIGPSDVGLASAWTSVTSYQARPPRSSGIIITDEGDAGVRLVEFLVSQKFV